MTMAMKMRDERKAGWADGLAKGRAEGRAEGHAEGRSESHTEIVKRMRARGLGLEEISDLIGLAVPEVKRLAEME